MNIIYRFAVIYGVCALNEKEKQAIEHILSDYKRILKENEELKFEEKSRIIEKYGNAEIHDVINRTLSNDYISVKKVKYKIKEVQKEYNKLDKQVEEYINDVNKDLSKYYENKEKIGTMQTLAWVIDNLQELLEGGK